MWLSATLFLLALSPTAEVVQWPLEAAVDKGDRAAVERLLAEGADVNQADADGTTALHFAALRNRSDLARLLLEKGANARAETKDAVTPLHLACLWYETRVAALLLAAKAEVDPRDADGRTPLHWAAEHGHLETVRFMLEKGASAGATDKLGRTPLHWVALSGEKAPVGLLLSKGAPIDSPDQRGDTPLHFAVWAGHRHMVKELLLKGANLTTRNHAGQTALDVVDGVKKAALVEFLRTGDPPVARFTTAWRYSLGDSFPFPCSSSACTWLAAGQNRVHVAGQILDRRTGRRVKDLRKRAQGAEFEDVTLSGDVAVLRFQEQYHGDLDRDLDRPAPATESTLLAVDAATGRSRWQAKGEILSPVSIGGDQVFFVRDRALWAVSAKTGKTRWKVQDDVYTSPVAGDQAVLVERSDGVRALHPDTGQPLWSLALPGRAPCPAGAGDGAFFVTRQLGEVSEKPGAQAKAHLWALDETTGKVRWEKDLVEERSDTSPLVSGKKIFLVTDGIGRPGHVRAHSAETGEILWTRDIVAGDTTQDFRPTVSDGLLLVWTGSLEEFERWAVSSTYSLLALELETGAIRWTYPLRDLEEKFTLSRPFFAQGLLVFSDGTYVHGRRLTGIAKPAHSALP